MSRRREGCRGIRADRWTNRTHAPRRRTSVLERLEDRFVLSGVPTAYMVDALTSSGAGTGTSGDLRYCINQANANPNAAGSVIQFDPTVFNASMPQTIALTSVLELSEAAGPEEIEGPGAGVVSISGRGIQGPNGPSHDVVGQFTAIDVNQGVTAAISGVTIGGAFGIRTRGLQNAGTLTIADTTVSGNSAVATGGGIENEQSGTLRITSSTISGNSAGNGGGIANEGMLTLVNSTIADNSVSQGGGIFNDGGTVLATSCTIAYNIALTGGIAATGSLGAGIDVVTGSLTLHDTIVALNTAGTGTADDIDGPISTVSSYNLVGTDGLVNGVNGNIAGVNNPRLGPLANNGGPTETIALLATSPAIDSGSLSLPGDADASSLTTDQRGTSFPRIVGSGVDIGAFEAPPQAVEHSPVPPPSGSTPPATGTSPSGAPPTAQTKLPSTPTKLVTVDGIQWHTLKQGTKKTTTATVLVVDFSGALEPLTAQTLGNYHLVVVRSAKKSSARSNTPVRLKSAVYDPAQDAVTLTIKSTIPDQKVQLTITAGNFLDSNGHPIDGNDDGQPGGNLVASFGKRGTSVSKQPASGALPQVSANAIDMLAAAGQLTTRDGRTGS